MKIAATLIVASAALGAVAHADVLHVPAQFPTIQSAIDAAAPGDEVLVAPGVYQEALTLSGEAVAITGEGGPEQTVIDAAGLGASAVTILGAGAADGPVIRGFTITGGAGTPMKFSIIGGGALLNNASALFRDCRFTGNTATDGAGVHMTASNAAFVQCDFDGNIATRDGGAIHASVGSSVDIVNARFVSNQAGQTTGRGGALRLVDADASIVNALFTGNGASSAGGAAAALNASLTLTNSSLLRNRSLGQDGAVFLQQSQADLRNSVLWDDGASNFTQIVAVASDVTAAHCNIRGANGSGAGWNNAVGVDLGGNIDLPPRFVDGDGLDNTLGTLDDDLRPARFSPLIGAGDPAFLPPDVYDLDGDGDTSEPLPVDLFGQPRRSVAPDAQDIDGDGLPRLDIGAHERRALTQDELLRVPSQHATIQDAIDAAGLFNAVLIEPGVYHEPVDLDRKSISIIGEQGHGLTTIRGVGAGPAVRIDSGEGLGAELIGLTIEPSDEGHAVQRGGGIVILDCVFDLNMRDGLRLSGGEAIIRDSAFNGGQLAMRADNAALKLKECSFSHNSEGAIRIEHGSLTAQECEFTENVSLVRGAVTAFHTTAEFTGCVFSDNQFLQSDIPVNEIDSRRSGITLTYGSLFLNSCLFTKNTSETPSSFIRNSSATFHT